MQEAREGKLEVSLLGSPEHALLYAVELLPSLPQLDCSSHRPPRHWPWWMMYIETTQLRMD